MATKVVVAGTFDGLHPGHLSFLSQAKDLADELVVIVARDQSVQQLKGHRPRQAEADRLQAVQSVASVDRAVLGSDMGDFLSSVVQLQPDVLALGYDQWPDEVQLKQQLVDRGLPKVSVVRLKAYQPDRYHSSVIQRTENRKQRTE